MVLDIRCTRDVSIGTLLLARGRDRLETEINIPVFPRMKRISYSLGDAIDWKQQRFTPAPFGNGYLSPTR